MSADLKTLRIPVMMSPAEVAAIEDWMFANRLRSRSDAMRRLCAAGPGMLAALQLICGDMRLDDGDVRVVPVDELQAGQAAIRFATTGEA